MQIMYDAKTNESIKICYDVVGQSQQSIFILEDKLLDARIYGILLDDYYMHQINIFHSNYKIIIDTAKINFEEKTIEWKVKNVGKMISLHQNIQFYVVNKHSITFTILNDQQLEKMQINVIRSKNSFGIEHLDIRFDYLDRRGGERYGGVIGDVQKKKVEKVMSVQGNNRIILKIDEKIIYGKEKRNSKINECILVSIKDILYPSSINEYAQFSVKN